MGSPLWKFLLFATLEPQQRHAVLAPTFAHPTLPDLMGSSGNLPSIPRIVAQVLKELDSEDPSPRNIVMLVSTDPALTAKIIALSNSVLFSPGRAIGSLQDAVTMLGFSHVRALVTTAALASSFKLVPMFNLEEFWHYSLNAALVSKTLARNLRLNEGNAFTLGLVHAIGELVLHLGAKPSMQLLDDIPFLAFSRSHDEIALLGYSHVDVGASFIEQWDFPDTLVQPLQDYARQVKYGRNANETTTPMVAMLHLAAWRSRCQLLALDDEQMHAHFPEASASALHLNIQDVLEKDPAQWTSSDQIAMFVSK